MPPRKGFFIRAATLLIDAVLISILTFSAAYAWYVFALPDQRRFTDAVTVTLLLLYTSTEIFLAATPGKLLLGLAIANANGTRAPISVLSFRWSTKYFWLICTLLFLLTNFVLLQFVSGIATLVWFGCFFAANDDHLAWHDKWCRTAIFRRRDLPEGPPAPPTPGSASPL